VPEDLLDERLPGETVKVCVTDLVTRERIPFIRSRSMRRHVNAHALFSICWSRFEVVARLIVT
jgi:hypothetical protein